MDADPYNLDAWLFVADVANEQKQYEKCVEAADYAIAIDPRNEKALRFKAIGELGLEHWDEVLQVYDTYRQLFPNDYSMALSAGEILVNKRAFSEARAVLETAAQHCPNEHPDKIRITGDIALTYAAEGDMSTAYAVLASTASLGVEQMEIYLRTAELALAHQQTEFAVRTVNHLAQAYGFPPEARRRIAHALCENNCFEDTWGGELWKVLLQSRPEDAAAASPYLAYAARRLRQGAAYLGWLEIALREEPQLTRQIFMQVYPFAAPDALLFSARAEFPEAAGAIHPAGADEANADSASAASSPADSAGALPPQPLPPAARRPIPPLPRTVCRPPRNLPRPITLNPQYIMQIFPFLRRSLLFFVACLAATWAHAAAAVDNPRPFVVPELTSWQGARGEFHPTGRIVVSDRAFLPLPNALLPTMPNFFSRRLSVVQGKGRAGDIVLARADRRDTLGTEGYRLTVGETATITAATAQGAFWGTRTILQISEQTRSHALPCGVATDRPAYPVRGFMIDVGRKYIPMDYLRQLAK